MQRLGSQQPGVIRDAFGVLWVVQMSLKNTITIMAVFSNDTASLQYTETQSWDYIIVM